MRSWMTSDSGVSHLPKQHTGYLLLQPSTFHLQPKPINQTFNQSINQPITIFCLSVCPSIFLSVILFASTYACPMFHISVHLHVNPSVRPSIHQSIHPSIHSFITEIYIAPLQDYNSETLPTLARLKRRVLRLE